MRNTVFFTFNIDTRNWVDKTVCLEMPTGELIWVRGKGDAIDTKFEYKPASNISSEQVHIDIAELMVTDIRNEAVVNIATIILSMFWAYNFGHTKS